MNTPNTPAGLLPSYDSEDCRYTTLDLCIKSALAQHYSTFVIYVIAFFVEPGNEFLQYYWTTEAYANSRNDLPGRYYFTVTTTPR